MSAQQFYGDAYNRGNKEKLDKAYERLTKAIANEATMGGTMSKVGESLLTLACKAENEAFAA